MMRDDEDPGRASCVSRRKEGFRTRARTKKACARSDRSYGGFDVSGREYSRRIKSTYLGTSPEQLCAVTALQEECLSPRNINQLSTQPVDLVSTNL